LVEACLCEILILLLDTLQTDHLQFGHKLKVTIRTILDLCDSVPPGCFSAAQLQTNDTQLLEEPMSLSQAQLMVAGGMNFLYNATDGVRMRLLEHPDVFPKGLPDSATGANVAKKPCFGAKHPLAAEEAVAPKPKKAKKTSKTPSKDAQAAKKSARGAE
jgi:hypothetical protein